MMTNLKYATKQSCFLLRADSDPTKSFVYSDGVT